MIDSKSIMETNSNLSQKAYEIIKQKIKYGELRQGDMVSISAIAESLNISRTPITIACQRLDQERLLTIAPKQGVIINTISIDDAREIYELRAAIESYSAKLAFSFITASDIELLQKNIGKQKQCMEAGDIYCFMEEDTVFHKYLLTRYRNSYFIGMLEVLFDKAFMIGVQTSRKFERLVSSIEEHESIVSSLITGDKNAFVRAVEFNIINGYVSLTSQQINNLSI